jgi:hypothetical protein
MLDAALIQQCADPSLKPAIVEQFVTAAGANDPLAVTVKSGGRLILIPKATTPDEAMAIVRQYVGQAVVRVGLTQFPAGVGVKDAADLKPDLVGPCENLRKGTAMFAKVLRIVAKWYGNPNSDDVFPQIFEDAVYAWKTGEFEGVSVFQAEDPGGPVANQREPIDSGETALAAEDASPPTDVKSLDEKEVGAAGMRIDLSRIGGQK